MPDIAQLTFQLDHPDVPTQQEAADALVALGPDHLDGIVANIEFATPRARRALIGVITRIGTPAAMINLMRFVWDRRGSIEDSDARGLAMKGIAELARPEDGARVLSFLMDVAEDHDPFVRAWTAQTLAALGDVRARAFLKQMLNDESEIVRERAQAGLEQLLDGTSDALSSQVEDTELLAKLRTASGAQQSYWVNELKARPNALELAARLVREGGKGQVFGLNFLLDTGDPIGRAIALNLLLREGANANRAIGFRLLAMHLRADADTDEREVIRGGLYDADVFVRAAAAMCAGAAGDDDLARRAIAAIDVADGEIALAGAKGLSVGLSEGDRHLFPALEAAFERVHRQRIASNYEALVFTEAYLLRAIGRAVSGTRGTSAVQRIALRALFDAEHHRPVLITGLELLEQSTPEEGLSADLRWSAELVRDLAMLLSVSDREVQQRTLRLLVRGAAAGNDGLTASVTKLVYEEPSLVVSGVVPLLERIGTERARTALNELAQSDVAEVKKGAASALLRLRNGQDWIDAEFDDSF